MKAISASYALPGSCVRFVQLILDTGEAYYFDMYRVSMLRPMKFQLDWAGPYESSLPNEMTQCAERNRSNLEGIFLKGGSSVSYILCYVIAFLNTCSICKISRNKRFRI